MTHSTVAEVFCTGNIERSLKALKKKLDLCHFDAELKRTKIPGTGARRKFKELQSKKRRARDRKRIEKFYLYLQDKERHTWQRKRKLATAPSVRSASSWSATTQSTGSRTIG